MLTHEAFKQFKTKREARHFLDEMYFFSSLVNYQTYVRWLNYIDGWSIAE